MVYTDNFTVITKGSCHIKNISEPVREIIGKSKISNGLVLIFVIGTTAGISTMEVGAELDKDLGEALDSVAPLDKKYHHDKKWQDHNGFSHIRSTLIGTSLVLPLVNGELVLSSWQEVVLLDFDTKKKDRLVTVQIVGE